VRLAAEDRNDLALVVDIGRSDRHPQEQNDLLWLDIEKA
jgi:hypothetical protein